MGEIMDATVTDQRGFPFLFLFFFLFPRFSVQLRTD